MHLVKGFNSGEQERGGAYLECGCVLRHIRITDEEMKSPVFCVIAERFISRIDDGAAKLNPFINFSDNMIGTLRNLIILLLS